MSNGSRTFSCIAVFGAVKRDKTVSIAYLDNNRVGKSKDDHIAFLANAPINSLIKPILVYQHIFGDRLKLVLSYTSKTTAKLLLAGNIGGKTLSIDLGEASHDDLWNMSGVTIPIDAQTKEWPIDELEASAHKMLLNIIRKLSETKEVNHENN